MNNYGWDEGDKVFVCDSLSPLYGQQHTIVRIEGDYAVFDYCGGTQEVHLAELQYMPIFHHKR